MRTRLLIPLPLSEKKKKPISPNRQNVVCLKPIIKDLNKPEKGFGEFNNSSTRTRHILPVSSQMADKVDTTTQDASRRKAEDKAFCRDQNILGLERWLSSKHLCSTKLSSDCHVRATASHTCMRMLTSYMTTTVMISLRFLC